MNIKVGDRFRVVASPGGSRWAIGRIGKTYTATRVTEAVYIDTDNYFYANEVALAPKIKKSAIRITKTIDI